MIRALVVDDHELFAEGIKNLFSPKDGISVTCVTKNGNEIPSILAENQIDVIVLDIDMPIIDGMETLDLLKRAGIDVPVLMLSMHQSIQRVRGALERGAQGYILKDASKADLVEAIIKVSKRKNYFHPKINDLVFEYLRGKSSAKDQSLELSGREIEVIKFLAEGKNTRGISKQLFISPHTVRTHRRNIMQKLHVKTSAELIKAAMELELI